MTQDFLVLDPEDIRFLHDDALDEYDGVEGELEPGMIDYMAEKPFLVSYGVEMYPSLFAKAAVYLEGFATHQYFADGNKRTGVKCCLTFLAIHGYELTVDDFELFEITLKVANNKMDLDEITEWLENNTRINYSFI